MSVTAKQIQQTLSNCRFNPKTKGPMKIVADVANPFYLEGKAHELIAEAGRFRTEEFDMETYRNLLTQAIQVLALAICHSEQ